MRSVRGAVPAFGQRFGPANCGLFILDTVRMSPHHRRGRGDSGFPRLVLFSEDSPELISRRLV
jgi:hypothetical protein